MWPGKFREYSTLGCRICTAAVFVLFRFVFTQTRHKSITKTVKKDCVFVAAMTTWNNIFHSLKLHFVMPGVGRAVGLSKYEQINGTNTHTDIDRKENTHQTTRQICWWSFVCMGYPDADEVFDVAISFNFSNHGFIKKFARSYDEQQQPHSNERRKKTK